MIQELRAVQSDVDARRHFTPENKPIRDARGFVADLFPKVIEYRPPELVAAKSATSLKSAAESGFIEVG